MNNRASTKEILMGLGVLVLTADAAAGIAIDNESPRRNNHIQPKMDVIAKSDGVIFRFNNGNGGISSYFHEGNYTPTQERNKYYLNGELALIIENGKLQQVINPTDIYNQAYTSYAQDKIASNSNLYTAPSSSHTAPRAHANGNKSKKHN